jgi:hypothetical protein
LKKEPIAIVAKWHSPPISQTKCGFRWRTEVNYEGGIMKDEKRRGGGLAAKRRKKLSMPEVILTVLSRLAGRKG